jgi:hypothetical protein
MGFAALSPPYEEEQRKKKKEAERRQTQCFVSAPAGAGRATELSACAAPPLRARSPVGVPLTASSWRCRNISVQLQAMLPGTRPLAHDPEKWKPVFRSDHAPLKSGTARWALPTPTCPSPVAPTAGHALPAADAQSRPGAVRNAARGHRTRSGLQVYLPTASFMSEIARLRNRNSDKCQ